MRLVFCAILSATFMLAACQSAEPETAGPPLGVWVWEAEEAESRLEIRISEENDIWRAQVQSAPAEIIAEGSRLSIKAPLGQSFSGEVSTDRKMITGRWHQPGTELAYSEMVTLVSIPLTGEKRWEGKVDLQPRPFRVFLDVFEDETDGISAVIRNPERNEIMRATRFRIESGDKGQWALVAGSGERQIRQSLGFVDGQLQLDHNWFAAPLALRPATSSDLTRYYARDLEREPITYSPPAALDDGWNVARAEDAGFDTAALDALVAELSQLDPRSPRPRLLHALLVAYKGQLVMEEYFYGHDRNTVHDTRSLGKVFAPVLVGALQQQRFAIDAEDRPIPGVLATAGERLDDPRKAGVSLAQLMSFTSGLDCDDNRDSPGSEDRLWSQQDEDDFWLYTAKLALLHEPGTRYAYCSASINLVGARLREVGEQPINELFDEMIARPLGFGPYHWSVAPNGAAYLGGGPYMRPRDILKIGAMHAANGQWNGQQILDPLWVDESTSTFIDITPETTGTTQEVFDNYYSGGGVAYEWSTDEIRVGDRSYKSYAASGNGGQVLVVVPELDLTVLLMGGNYRQYGIWGRWRDDLIGGHIIPAISKSNSR
ncbi:MAG: serine hydrolase domain-containing protein [Henriciella sp.]